MTDTRVYLDPTSERTAIARSLAERPASLEGKVVGLLDIIKPRGDVFLEKLHTGEIFGGQAFVILSDIAAGALVLTLITGYWLWLVPKLSRGARDGDAA